MFWVPLAMAAAGAAMGAAKSNEEEARMKRQAKLRAAEQRSAPWTGRQNFTEIQQPTSSLGNVLGGAMSGFSTGQSIGGAFPTGGGSSFSSMPGAGPSLGVNTNLSDAGIGSSLQGMGMGSAPQGMTALQQPGLDWRELMKKQPTLYGGFGSSYGSMGGSV